MKHGRITRWGTSSYTVDANGNTTQRGTDTFSYDTFNRLTSATVGGVTTTYSYNGDGLRVSSTTGGVTTRYVYDVAGGLPLLLDDGSRTYIWGAAGLAYSVDKSSGAATWSHADGLGSVRALTDSTGWVVQTYGADAWGVPVAAQTLGSVMQPMQFTGEPRDSTGLVYLRARLYDPQQGRFMQRDTVAGVRNSPQSLNPFSYVGNSPSNYSDPTGHCVPFCLGAVVVGGSAIGVDALALAALGATGVYVLRNQIASGLGDALASTGGFGETLKVGPHAGESIPARGPSRDFTPEEREKLDRIGKETGCHTCGAEKPATTSGHWVPDHQPPNGLAQEGDEQRLYPQCLDCSRKQGGEMREYKRRQQTGTGGTPPGGDDGGSKIKRD